MATTTSRTTALPRPVGPEGLSQWSRALREDVLADANSFDERAIIMAESFRAALAYAVSGSSTERAGRS